MLKPILAALLALFFSGCLSRELPLIHHYELFVKDSSNACESYRNYQWLGIEVANKINSKNIAYKESPNKIEYFSKNQWITNLSDMLDTLIPKIAKNHCIALLQTPNIPQSLKISIFDLHFEDSQIFFNAQGETLKNNIPYVLPIRATIAVENGGFETIIEAMNKAIIVAFNEFFKAL
ncbi:hypothetical protein [Helicobacter mesocricetorum]|uniref:hypothetical protein n=1 Tax=Helicobacter mesocricetorum TaxID=87012 RepID=UPI000CF1A144|nr:hypothetical protein [Helicobacter mesocricetorum]